MPHQVERRATVFSSTRFSIPSCVLARSAVEIVLSWHSVGLAEVSETDLHVCEFLCLLRSGLKPLCAYCSCVGSASLIRDTFLGLGVTEKTRQQSLSSQRCVQLNLAQHTDRMPRVSAQKFLEPP